MKSKRSQKTKQTEMKDKTKAFTATLQLLQLQKRNNYKAILETKQAC